MLFLHLCSVPPFLSEGTGRENVCQIRDSAFSFNTTLLSFPTDDLAFWKGRGRVKAGPLGPGYREGGTHFACRGMGWGRRKP